MVREIGSDTTAMITILAFIASLPVGKPAFVLGVLLAEQRHLLLTAASRLSPEGYLAVQFVIRTSGPTATDTSTWCRGAERRYLRPAILQQRRHSRDSLLRIVRYSLNYSRDH
eukprot:6237993-Pyramimonas_sp.AAC.2